MSDVAAGDAGSFFDDSDAYDGERGGRTYEQTGSNLTLHRWHDPILTPGEERDLIRAAQGEDRQAKDRLLKCFHRLILKLAKQYYGPSRDDLIAAGAIGLLEAIHRFDLRRNNGLAAYATHWIRKEISEAVKLWYREGEAGETRADRLVYSTANLTANEVATKVGCSPLDARRAIWRAESHSGGHDPYDATESLRYSDGDDDDTFIGPKAAGSHGIYRMYGYFSPYQLSPQLRLHEAASNQIDGLAATADMKAAARLKQMGRRRYAQWLVDRDRRIAEDRRVLQDTDHWLYGQRRRDPVLAENSKLWLEQMEAARRKRRLEGAKVKLIRCEKLDDARMQSNARHKQVA